MIGFYLRLIFSPTAYAEWAKTHAGPDIAGAWERVKSPLKGVLLALGAAIVSGQIDLGPKAWWTAPFIFLVSALIQKKVDPVGLWASLTDAQKDAIEAHRVARNAVAVVPPSTLPPAGK